jgi:hypothetical protein
MRANMQPSHHATHRVTPGSDSLTHALQLLERVRVPPRELRSPAPRMRNSLAVAVPIAPPAHRQPPTRGPRHPAVAAQVAREKFEPRVSLHKLQGLKPAGAFLLGRDYRRQRRTCQGTICTRGAHFRSTGKLNPPRDRQNAASPWQHPIQLVQAPPSNA